MSKLSFGIPKEKDRDSPAQRKRTYAKTKTDRCDRIMLFCILALGIFGSFMICSASTAYASIRFNDTYYFVRRQALWFLLGIIAMACTARIPSQALCKYTPYVFGITLFLLLLVPIFGTEAGGAKRWIGFGPFTFQPSEFAKSALVLMLARYFSKQDIKKRRTFRKGIFVPLLFLLSLIAAILPEKHLSCVIILGFLTISMIFIAGSNGKILGFMCGGGGLAVSIFALAVDYTRRRITIWLNPAKYPRDGGWQTLQGLMAIGSGGFFGLGYGNSRLKYLYVSEPQNDFIFTIICEELGFVGAVAVILLFALFVYRGTEIAAAHPDDFTALLTIGLTLKVAIQAILNICVITNTLPNTGISLPFFSYGGSSLVMLFAEMGLILSASRSAHIKR